MTTKRTAHVIGTIGIPAFLLIGCGVVPPRVQYSKVSFSNDAATTTAAQDQSGYTFRHRRSVLKVSYDNEFKVVALPSELDSDGKYTSLYQFNGADDYRSTTQLKPTYADNTKFIDQIQITTTDNIAATIDKIGEVAKAVIPLVAGAVSAQAAPAAVTFNATVIDPAKVDGNWTSDPINDNYCIRLTDVAVESELDLDSFVANSAAKWGNSFPVPACSTGIVEIAYPCSNPQDKINAVASIRVTYASSTKVVPTRLPSTGSLKMNSVCGASITEADKQDRTDFLDYVSKGAKTAQDVLTAWKNAKTSRAAKK